MANISSPPLRKNSDTPLNRSRIRLLLYRPLVYSILYSKSRGMISTTGSCTRDVGHSAKGVGGGVLPEEPALSIAYGHYQLSLCRSPQ